MSCTLLQYCNKFTVMQIKLVVVVVVKDSRCETVSHREHMLLAICEINLM